MAEILSSCVVVTRLPNSVKSCRNGESDGFEQHIHSPILSFGQAAGLAMATIRMVCGGIDDVGTGLSGKRREVLSSVV
jgi:hypothetical protein